ncbi:pro-Pol polyprotein [Trichonephila clavipes]|nr:pro-Pol polyprotein [Trichonephila clavipes]
MTPFQLLTGVKMRTKQDLEILKLLEEEIVETFTENREKIREEAKRNILKMQEENCRNFNKKRKKAYQYEIGDIVAIQRTQFGTGLKLRPKFFGPYEVIKVKPKDRYDVRKIGLHEGPNTTSTAADHMKIFSSGLHGSTAADSVRSEWLLWHAAKSNAVFARRRIELKMKQKLLDIGAELERERERERCASRRYLLNIIVNLICKNNYLFN